MGAKEDAVRQRIEAERVQSVMLKNDRVRRQQHEIDRLMQEIEKERERVVGIINQEGVDWSKGVLATFPVPSPRWWNRDRLVDEELALYIVGTLGYARKTCIDIPRSVDLAVRSDGQLAVCCRLDPEFTSNLQKWSESYGRHTASDTILARLKAALGVLRIFEPPTA